MYTNRHIYNFQYVLTHFFFRMPATAHGGHAVPNGVSGRALGMTWWVDICSLMRALPLSVCGPRPSVWCPNVCKKRSLRLLFCCFRPLAMREAFQHPQWWCGTFESSPRDLSISLGDQRSVSLSETVYRHWPLILARLSLKEALQRRQVWCF